MALFFEHIAHTISFPVVGVALAGNTGFQSSVDDNTGQRIDLSRELVNNQSSTFCWRISGQSFAKMGIPDGSIGVFDYSLKPQRGNIVLVRLHDVVSIKILCFIHGKPCLTSASDGYPVIPINEDDGVQIMGVMRHYVVSV